MSIVLVSKEGCMFKIGSCTRFVHVGVYEDPKSSIPA